MADLRRELEREAERFVVAPGLAERVADRRLRKERERRIVTAAFALLIGIGGTLVALHAFHGRGEVPAATPAPSFGAIAGSYRATLSDGDPAVRRGGMAGAYAMELHADGRITMTIPRTFAAASRLGIHPSGYVFRIDGDRFTTNLFVNGPGCSTQGVGAYRWSRTGSRLRFLPIHDSCPERRTLLSAADWRISG